MSQDTLTTPSPKKLRIAVQGCCHGELQTIYSEITKRCYAQNEPLPDLLLVLGDFQSLRSTQDFDSISIPPKYIKLGDFHKYYDGTLVAPIPTLFIGGNHENMRHLMSLPYGGYAAENIYYAGFSNCLIFQSVKIGCLSGIYKWFDFEKPRPSYNSLESNGLWRDSVRSLYHVRKEDVLPLFMLHGVNIFMSHDWPCGIVKHGNLTKLLQKKPFFKQDVQRGKLGSEVNWQLLKHLKPSWWLSAHLHVKFEAQMVHTDKRRPSTTNDTSLDRKKSKQNKDEIDLDLDLEENDEEEEEKEEKEREKNTDANPSRTPVERKSTKFLALDKCVKHRQFLDIIEVDVDEEHPTYSPDHPKLYWDPEFIASLRYLKSNVPAQNKLDKIDFEALARARGEVKSDTVDWTEYAIPEFVQGIERKEFEQTRIFEDKFLNP